MVIEGKKLMSKKDNHEQVSSIQNPEPTKLSNAARYLSTERVFSKC